LQAKRINQIEAILLNCYSNEARKVLIKSNKNTKQNLVDDGYSILKCLNIDNPILNMAIRVIGKHSQIYGDNCKILFVYISEFIRYLNTNKHACEMIRQLNINEFDLKLRTWIEKENEYIIDYKKELKLNVFNDLKFAPQINQILQDLMTNLLRIYNENYQMILDDFEHILINNLS
jgi:chaperonin GroEL (HSP60 family)